MGERMILAPSTHELILFLLGCALGASRADIEAAGCDPEALDSLLMLGLSDGDGILSTHAEEVLVGCVRCDDIERLPGAMTAFGRVAGLALPNDGHTVKISFTQGPRILTIELPADCWIQVIS